MSLFVIVSLLVFINSQEDTVSQPSYITLRFNKTGAQSATNTNFYKLPEKIYINGELSESNNILVNINNVSDTVKLEWNAKLTSCKDMFRDCTEVAMIDLSDFDSSSVRDTSSMFRNCNLLTSLNLNGFDTSSVETMEAMFFQAKSLRRVDLSHFVTSKVTNMNKFLMECNRINS